MKSFIFGADDLPKTPQELARMRAMAEALAPSRAPQNVGEGIASIGNAILYRSLMKKADGAETAGKAKANSAFSALMAPSMFPPAPGRAASPAAPEGTSPQAAMASVSPANDPVADVLAAGQARPSGGDQSWLRYANQGATRSQPLDPKLTSALGFLPEFGVQMEVFSGGQPEAGQGPRTGSVRHDHGGAADVFFYKDGKKLDWSNPQDRPIFEDIVRRGKAAGITGFGAGDGYMQPGSMHLGFGNPAVWGAGGKGANAPDWLRKAYAGETSAPPAMAAQPGMAATASPALGYVDPMVSAPNGRNAQPPAPPLPAPVDVQNAPQVMPQGEQQQAQNWIPPEFQNSPQLQAANPNIGILRALTGQGAGTGMPAPQLDMNQAIQLVNDPYMDEGKKAVIQSLIGQEQAKQKMQMEQQDPKRILEMRKMEAEIKKLENPAPAAKPTDIQEYEYAKSQGFEGSFVDFQLAQKKAGAASTVVNTGEGDKFYQTLDTENAKTFSALSSSGMQAQSKLGEIDRLDQLMANSPQGAVGALKQAAGEWGIATEGLSDIQAATALIDRLVPQQRPVGSGQMSDGDVKLFRGSLPRIINQPGGNQLITQTLRGIAQYEIETGNIADRVANREITPAEGRKLLREVKNPLAGFKAPAPGPTPNEGWGELPGIPGVKVRPKGSQ